jgi:hypothetical protein
VTELTDTVDFARTRTRPGRWRSTRLWLAVFSVLICAGALQAFNSHAPKAIMGSRATDVAASIAVLDRGGPPLLASDVRYHAGIAVSHLRPVGVTDDEGIYVYLPVLSKLTGERDPATLMKWLFMGCFALLVLVYPLMFFELFGSAAVAVAAPFLVLWKFEFTQSLDLYWILAWCMLLGIPGLVLAYQWWSADRKRAAVLLLTALMLVASFATSIRIHAGLALLIGALGIVALTGASAWRQRSRLLRFWRISGWWARPAIAVGLVLVYLSIGTFGLAAVRAYRNHVIHQSAFGSTWPTQHPFWHAAYIGLGYLPNRYGIAWSDDVAADAVLRDRPGTGYLTTTSEATLRHQYVQIAKKDPGFVLRNFWTKARILVADAVSRFWPAFILLPIAVLVGGRRRSMRVALLVALPAGLLGALAPLLTVPYLSYELAWLGTVGALFVLALGWLWVSAKAAAADLPPDLAPLRDRPDRDALHALRVRLERMPAAWAGAAALAVTLLLAGTARPAAEPTPSLPDPTQSAVVSSSWLDRRAVQDWEFAGALPPGWTTLAPVFLERDPDATGRIGLYVRSPMAPSEDLLSGPPVDLPAGTFDLVTSGQALVDGLQIGVRTPDGASVSTSMYSTRQPWDIHTQAMRLRFTLPAPIQVHVVVSSWSAYPDASAWVLWKMAILAARKH